MPDNSFFGRYKTYLLALFCTYVTLAMTIGIAATFRPSDMINHKQYVRVVSKSMSLPSNAVPLECPTKKDGYPLQICESHMVQQWYMPNADKKVESHAIFLSVVLLTIILLGWFRAGFGSKMDHVPWKHYGIYFFWLVIIIVINGFLSVPVRDQHNHSVIACTAVFLIFFSEFWNILYTSDFREQFQLTHSVSRPLMIIFVIFIELVVLVAYAWGLSATVQFHHTLAESWAGFGWSFVYLPSTIVLLLFMRPDDTTTLTQPLPTAIAQPIQPRKPRFKDIEIKF